MPPSMARASVLCRRQMMVATRCVCTACLSGYYFAPEGDKLLFSHTGGCYFLLLVVVPRHQVRAYSCQLVTPRAFSAVGEGA